MREWLTVAGCVEEQRCCMRHPTHNAQYTVYSMNANASLRHFHRYDNRTRYVVSSVGVYELQYSRNYDTGVEHANDISNCAHNHTIANALPLTMTYEDSSTQLYLTTTTTTTQTQHLSTRSPTRSFFVVIRVSNSAVALAAHEIDYLEAAWLGCQQSCR